MDLARNRHVGIRIEHDAGIGAEPHLSRVFGRQINVHVHIRGVEHHEHLAAGQQHFADIGDAILDAPLARRDQRIVGDLDVVEFHVMGSGVPAHAGDPITLQLRGAERCLGPVQLLLSLVHDFLGLGFLFRQ